MNKLATRKIELSVIIPVTERYDPVEELYYEYKRGIEAVGMEHEIIYVLDGRYPEVLETLITLQKTEQITVITLAKLFGEATALTAAFSKASGEILLTLPAYQQVEADEIPGLVSAIDDCDMVMARRCPREDSIINKLQSRVFNFLLRSFTELKIHDAGCGARVLRRQVVDEVHIYGDLHRFLPITAHRQGFRVKEVDVAQSKGDVFRRIYAPGVYVRRLLDLLTVFFLVKFTKKPLRFFGLVGSTLFGIGLLVTLYITGERLFFHVALANRPALIMSSLLIVLGVQIIAIGLIGEIIIFTHARDIKEYKIDRIIN